MGHDGLPPDGGHLVWIYTDSPVGELSAATWLSTTKELRQLGWRVTLIAACPAGRHTIRGVEVQCVPMPETYVVRQLLFHLRVLRFLGPQWGTIDVILCHPMSVLWLLPLRLVRALTGSSRPVIVMDTRTVAMTLATR